MSATDPPPIGLNEPGEGRDHGSISWFARQLVMEEFGVISNNGVVRRASGAHVGWLNNASKPMGPVPPIVVATLARWLA